MWLFREIFGAALTSLRFVFGPWLRRSVNVMSAPRRPARRARDMSATSLTDRRCAGARCRGFLGRAAVTMLAG